MISLNSEDKLNQLFLSHLASFSLSKKTLKNYNSDLSHFTGWLIFRLRSYGVLANSLSETLPFLKNELAYEYKSFLVENKEPYKTVNRRLSTLRHLARFFLESQIIDFDFMQGISNLYQPKDIKLSQHPAILEFQRHLEKEKVSRNTIKNYLSDVRQFMSWLENQKQQN